MSVCACVCVCVWGGLNSNSKFHSTLTDYALSITSSPDNLETPLSATPTEAIPSGCSGELGIL